MHGDRCNPSPPVALAVLAPCTGLKSAGSFFKAVNPRSAPAWLHACWLLRLWCHNEGAGTLIRLLGNFMLPVFGTGSDAQLAGTVETGVLLPLPRGISSRPRVRVRAAGEAATSSPIRPHRGPLGPTRLPAPLNLRGTFLTPSNRKVQLQIC